MNLHDCETNRQSIEKKNTTWNVLSVSRENSSTEALLRAKSETHEIDPRHKFSSYPFDCRARTCSQCMLEGRIQHPRRNMVFPFMGVGWGTKQRPYSRKKRRICGGGKRSSKWLGSSYKLNTSYGKSHMWMIDLMIAYLSLQCLYNIRTYSFDLNSKSIAILI